MGDRRLEPAAPDPAQRPPDGADLHRADLRQLCRGGDPVHAPRPHPCPEPGRAFRTAARRRSGGRYPPPRSTGLAAAGCDFARNPDARGGDPAIRNIAVFQDGSLLAALQAAKRLAAAARLSRRQNAFRLWPGSGLGGAGWRQDHRRPVRSQRAGAILAAAARGASLPAAPPSPAAPAGAWTAQGRKARSRAGPSPPPRKWTVKTRSPAGAACCRSIIFVILGPAIAGGWLAALFVGAFERQQKRRMRYAP